MGGSQPSSGILRPSHCFSLSALVTPVTRSPELLGGNHLVIIVGIVCATVLLLAVLILLVKRTHRSKRYRAARTPGDRGWKRDRASPPSSQKGCFKTECLLWRCYVRCRLSGDRPPPLESLTAPHRPPGFGLSQSSAPSRKAPEWRVVRSLRLEHSCDGAVRCPGDGVNTCTFSLVSERESAALV